MSDYLLQPNCCLLSREVSTASDCALKNKLPALLLPCVLVKPDVLKNWVRLRAVCKIGLKFSMITVIAIRFLK